MARVLGQLPTTQTSGRVLGALPTPTVAPTQPPQQDFLHHAGSVLDTIFGGGKIGEYIGTKIGEALAPADQKQFYDTSTPSAGELAGSALQSASLFLPVGRVAGAVTKGLTEIGLKTGSKLLGKVAAGAGAGEVFDVAQNLQNGESPLAPGTGTVIGAAAPFVPPILKGAVRVAGESLGVSTGAGYGAIKELFNASSKGGVAKQTAVDALRGNTSPEQVVQEAKSALTSIKQSRQTAYQRSLTALKGDATEHDIAPIAEAVKTNLDKFGVTVAENGTIDFSRSPIRFDAQAQKDITQILQEMKTFGSRPDDKTVIGLDSLKRAFGDLYTPSGQARAFVTSIENSVRDILGKVPGYNEMAADYTQKSHLINDINKALSLGDKASVDTAFRKLTTVLRTNNEERKVLVDELDAISGGKLTPMIAGQQMSEVLPRGLARQIEGFGALGSIMAGFGLPLLKLALFASPRVVGEMVNALGIGSRATNYLLNVLGVKGLKAPGDVILDKIKK